MRSKTKYLIGGVTISLLVYLLSINLEVTFSVIFFLFLITTVGLWWMVYAILTDTSNLSGRTFDEYFYEDADYKP
jgi:hypothetical protein